MSEQAATEALDRLEQRYNARFAGRPRVTRDPDELEEIVAELERIGAEAPAVAERVAGLRKVYGEEIAAITAARAEPFAVQAARLRIWAELSFSRYERSFAGRDRRTRDVALLEEILEDLSVLRPAIAAIHERAPALRTDLVLGQIDRAIGGYAREATEIRNVRRAGDPADQGSRLALLANHQFHVYTMLFAKQPRISRHPRALTRILGALEEIRRGMEALQRNGFADPNNDANLRLVEDRLRAFHRELGEIRRVRDAAGTTERVSALGAAANEVAARYREAYSGRQRSEVDPEGLNDLFEQLWPIAREMDDIDREHDDEVNAKNLRVVTDNLQLYAEEYRQVTATRGAAGSG